MWLMNEYQTVLFLTLVAVLVVLLVLVVLAARRYACRSTIG
jgi:hypothetical protein